MEARIEPAFYDRTQAIDNDGNYTTAEIPYFVFEVEDEDAAIEFALANVPVLYNKIPLESIEIDERISSNVFKITAQYKAGFDETTSSGNEEPDPVYSFDTGGGTQHLTQSLKTVAKYPPAAPDYGGAIGYDGEDVKGVDVTMPVMNFSETHYLKPRKVTTKYKKTIGELTGSVNNGSFKGYAEGEVLFLGATGSRRGDSRSDLWEVTYKFAMSANRKNIKVGELTVTEKKGWDYLWVRYADDVKDKKTLVKKPIAAYVEKVYERKDLGQLGIGK
ncbi:MAG: hypothetical protein PHH77_10700 [Victivallaceae bacterium]|nr:hypothetical protein [Victivallaceae bacterium]